jgi:hypothetical protein
MTDPEASCGEWPVSPTILAARKRAETVAPGRMVRTTLSGAEATELMGLEGASFIVKLPESAPSNTWLLTGGRWYVDGQPVDDPSNPRYIEWRNEKTRTWLIDVGCIFNLFAAVSDSEVALAHRHRSLDARGWGRVRVRLPLPEGAELPDDKGFSPLFSYDRDICLGEDIPLVALIIPTTIPITRKGRDLLTIAREDSAVAYVWSVKFEGK